MMYLYARVSTLEQARDNAVSLPEQLRKCRAVATMRGASKFDFIEYVDEGVSGTVPLNARPYGREMMIACRECDTVIAAKLDRLFRSATDALNTIELLKKIGVALIILDFGVEPIAGNGISKLFFGILAMMAEFERERIRERTEEGRRGKRARNGFIGGGVPFGYECVGSGRDAIIRPHEQEQVVIAKIKELTRNGHKPGRVVRYLTQYHPTRTGKPWQEIQVQRILKHG
jgi:putative DNA-invertase from lambdoid prophage Rac